MTFVTAALLSESGVQLSPQQQPRTKWCRRLLRWVEHVLAAAAGLWLLLLISPLPHWLHGKFDRQGELQRAKYIICLGGDPGRVIEGARLLAEGHGEKLIVSNNPGAAALMRQLAIEWGAAADRILVDNGSWRTSDHPASIQRACGVNPAQDVCIIVTTYMHMIRAKGCFEKQGYRHLIMREPRWDRQFRSRDSSTKNSYWVLPELLYECAALLEYRLKGWI